MAKWWIICYLLLSMTMLLSIAMLMKADHSKLTPNYPGSCTWKAQRPKPNLPPHLQTRTQRLGFKFLPSFSVPGCTLEEVSQGEGATTEWWVEDTKGPRKSLNMVALLNLIEFNRNSLLQSHQHLLIPPELTRVSLCRITHRPCLTTNPAFYRVSWHCLANRYGLYSEILLLWAPNL